MDRLKRYRVMVGALLLLLTLGIVGGLFYMATVLDEGDDAGAATVRVRVKDSHGSALFDGDVALANATALTALDAAAREGNFTYETRLYPGMGTYVRAINGTAEEGSGGWVFRVLSDGEWCWGDRAADRYALQDGDAVVWEWADAPNSGGCSPT